MWAAAGCLSLGLGAAHIGQRFSVPSAILSLLGAIALLLFCVRIADLRHKRLKISSWKRPALMASAAAASVILLILVNFLAYSLPWRWDLTKAKQHTLSKSAAELLDGLKQDVQLTAFYAGVPPKYLSDLFQEFKRNSKGRIKPEIIDPIVRIGYAAQFGSVISGKENKVIVRSAGEKGARRDVDFTNKILSEELLINAIIGVTRKERTVYFLTGHSEYDILDKKTSGLSQLAGLLSENNITSKKLMLGVKGEIPADCDVLVIAGPHTQLTKKEKGLIRKYLKKGGDALFLIENVIVTTPDKPLTWQEKQGNPSLNGILSDWGVKVGDDIVVDLSNHVGSDAGTPATKNYIPHPSLTEGLDYTFYIRPRSISELEGRRTSLKLVPIVLTASKEASWGETDRTLQIKFDPNADVPGPVPIAYVVFEPKEKEESSDTRVIIFTDADFLTNAFIGQYSNAKLGLNVFNWLSEADYRIFISEKEISVIRLDLTSKQKRMVAVVLLLILFLIIASGITVWVRQME